MAGQDQPDWTGATVTVHTIGAQGLSGTTPNLVSKIATLVKATNVALLTATTGPYRIWQWGIRLVIAAATIPKYAVLLAPIGTTGNGQIDAIATAAEGASDRIAGMLVKTLDIVTATTTAHTAVWVVASKKA